MADGLLNKASIILTPTGYKAGTLYNVAPVVEPYEDFDFARASVASRVNSSGLVEMVGRTLSSELVQNGDFSELGSELVVNGDFATDSDWTKGTNTTIEDGKAILNVTSGGLQYITNVGLDILNTKTYKITFTANRTSGTGDLELGYSNGNRVTGTPIISTNGTQTIYFKPTYNTPNLGFKSYTTSGNYTWEIDNVSVKQVDPNDYWNLGTGRSIGDGKASFDGGSDANIIQTNSDINIGNTFKITLDVSDMDNGELSVRLGGGAATEIARIEDNGSYVFYGVSISSNITFRALSSFNGSIDNVSVKEVIDTNNIPRISYDSNGDNGHILLEPTSTNLLPYSEDFSEWSKSSGGIGIKPVITADNVVSPNGVQNAEKVVFDLNGGGSGDESVYSLLTQNYTSVNGTTYSLSCYLKGESGGEQIIFDFDSQNSNVVTLTNEWVRYTFSKTVSTNGSRSIRFGSRGNNSGGTYGSDNPTVYIWGAQLEALPYATSYIPTLTGSQEVRATETATGAGSADLINSTEGVLYAEIAKVQDDNDNYILISLNNAASNSDENSVAIGFDNSDDFYVRLKSGNSDILKSDGQNATANNFHKIAIRYKSGDSAIYINGSEATYSVGDGTATFSFAVTLDNLSFDYDGNSGLPFYGKCKALAVFNEALSDSELTQLTT